MPKIRAYCPVLEVKRQFEPLELRTDPWVRLPYTATVWSFDGRSGSRTHQHESGMPDYVPGLLRCYIDGEPVGLDTFESALHTIGLTLGDVTTAVDA